MKRIALDMDEVLADVVSKFLDIYESNHGRRPRPEEYRGKKIYQLPGAEGMRDVLFEPGFFRDLGVMSGSQEVVKELMEDYEVFVVTAAQEFRNSLTDKYDWLEAHFPFISWENYVFCGNKQIVRADYMIDDHVFNLEGFQGKGLLYTASHNMEDNQFTRVNDWQEIRAFFQRELEEAP